MRKIIYSSILLATATSFSASITAVRTNVTSSGDYEIIFKDAGVVPTAFNNNNPVSIVLDFKDTDLNMAQRRHMVNQNGVQSVDIAPGEGRTRAVIALDQLGEYDVRLRGSDAVLVLKGGRQATRTAASTGNTGLFNAYETSTTAPNLAQSPQEMSVAARERQSNIGAVSKEIDLKPVFHRNSDGGGIFAFTLPSRDTLVQVTTEGSSVIATVQGYALPREGQKRLDVGDYGSPVRYIDILPSGRENTRILLNMGREPYEYVAYQDNGRYVIEIKRPSMDEEAQRLRELSGFGSGKQYTGELLSLNFQDIEVRAVLQIIAEFTNTNIVVSDSVTGNVTLRLDNVPWDQALDIIMRTKGLAMRRVENVMYIAPESELNAMEIEALRAWRSKQELAPSNTEVIQLKYARASDVAAMIEASRNFLSDMNQQALVSDDAILSSKGTIAVDERTNSLLVSDIPAKLQRVRDLVVSIDKPVRQVLLDSRVVVTSDTFSRSLGVGWGVRDTSGGRFIAGVTSEDENTGRLVGLTSSQGIISGLSDLSDAPFRSGFSIIGSDVNVRLEIAASQNEGLTETLSSPRVITQDGYTALIAKGVEVPYSTVSDSGTETEFKDAKLSMEVTPRITPNDRVSMDIHITKDDVVNSSLGSREPYLNTNEVNTRVEVGNGETVVLGGIYEQEQSVIERKVPLLGDVPVVGYLFRSTQRQFDKEELLIFITPRILDTQLSTYDKFNNLRD